MWNMIWPIIVVVGANTVYNISTKSTPTDISPFASLAVSYLIGAVCSVVMLSELIIKLSGTRHG